MSAEKLAVPVGRTLREKDDVLCENITDINQHLILQGGNDDEDGDRTSGKFKVSGNFNQEKVSCKIDQS